MCAGGHAVLDIFSLLKKGMADVCALKMFIIDLCDDKHNPMYVLCAISKLKAIIVISS